MKYANQIGWSDIDPYEVVKVISDKTIEVRAMLVEKDPTWKPDIIPGGFAGHCINQHEQKWNIKSDESKKTFRIRLHKNGQWKSKFGSRFMLQDTPVKFYDYNF